MKEEEIGADWSTEEMQLLVKGLKKFPVGSVRRWDQISIYLGSRTPQEVIAVSKSPKLTVDGAALSKSSGNAFEQFVKDKETHASNASKNAIVKEQSTRLNSFSDVDVKLTGAAAEAVVGKEGAADENEWTLVQEQALVKAVKAFPKGSGGGTEKDRWLLIAKAVPGKNPSQCIKHMPVMLARMRANKAAA